VDVRIERDRIAAIAPRLHVERDELEVRLSGELLLPGLVNAHDHLHLDVLPRVPQGPYANAHIWSDRFSAEVRPRLARYLALDKRDRYRWGGLRNLLSGATWVAHHDPWERTLGSADFPVHVVHPYTQVTSLRLGDARRAYRKARGRSVFFIHLAEGTDGACEGELTLLEAIGALGSKTILVHGVGLTASDRERINATKAAVVLCPSSNMFLLDARPSATGIERVLLGTDSTLTGSDHLLDEIRVAHEVCSLSEERLLAMVTHQAAATLRLPLGAGRLEVGAPAHLIALRASEAASARALLSARPRNVSLVVVDGEIRSAAKDIFVAASLIQRSRLEGEIRVDGELRRIRTSDAVLVNRIRAQTPDAAPMWLGEPHPQPLPQRGRGERTLTPRGLR
jgi:cytosine/adenosine deaminase-related metal-dependent hydrolase